MIQEIAPGKLHNEFKKDANEQADDLIFVFEGRKIFAGLKDGRISVPVRSELADGIETTFLFTINETNCFLYAGGKEALPEGYDFIPLMELRLQAKEPKEIIFSALTAFQLANWYKDNRYCGTCGSLTVHAPDERAIMCPKCRRRIYPRILPAVIVAVTDGDRILFIRYADRPLRTHALIAGFTEIGETLEETVEREVMEEVGIKVKNVRYFKSQPWGIVDDILMGFYCDVDGSSEVHVDNHELAEGTWFRRDEIPYERDDFSLTNEMMITFKEGKEPK
ncbi:MAG: NAD(+) diphosphatase [Lachnospiraceae bacterium]|nr:NAD(+) diphosphatase [Lachnospiraceae bacterium]